MQDEKRGRIPRWLKVVGSTVLAVVLALYVVYPVGMAVVATWPARAEVGPAPPGFETVALQRADGVRLAAWYAPSRNGAAIIVAHGAGASRSSMRRQAAMLADHGFGVLALDMSGHGQSQGRTNRLAWQGTADITAAVDFLKRDPRVRHIGAYGSSMGGEAVLGASAENPEIQAMVADGATRRSTAELRSLPSERPLVRSFTASVMYAAVRLLAWQKPPKPLLGEMQTARDTRYLLIAAGNDELETAFNRHFAETLGGRAELWVARDVGHAGALSAYPDEYEERVVTFFGDALH